MLFASPLVRWADARPPSRPTWLSLADPRVNREWQD
jgi:hypothetical protein